MDISFQQAAYSRSQGRRSLSLTEKRNRTQRIETMAESIFTLCAFLAVFAVGAITLYMVANGVPVIYRLGVREILFSSAWKPVAADPSYGILYVILTSVTGTVLAVALGVPVALLTAVFLAEIAPRPLAALVRPAVELLAGIPSVVYGLLGMLVLNPLMYRLEQVVFHGSRTHQFTGGANLLSAVLVLVVMILPTVISVSETALRAVPDQLRVSSMALGASRIQTIFQVVLPAARPGITTAVVLGVGRAVGEAMAINLVSGGSVNVPLPFFFFFFLTTAIVSEMGYAEGVHRQVLFTIGLVLFGFIMLVNILLHKIMRGEDG